LVIVVGGGNEGLKKVNTLLTQECEILLISDSTNRQIQNYVKQKKDLLKKDKACHRKLSKKIKTVHGLGNN